MHETDRRGHHDSSRMSRVGAWRTLRSFIFHALRAGFRVLPVGETKRDTWRQYFLERFPTIRPIIPLGQSSPKLERRARAHASGRAIGFVERTEQPLPDPMPARLVAFYLPQFHTIPENDAHWGKGFTEWRNVARALPQFEGHHQPRLPGDFGFYDLRNPQVLREQAALAQAYGIGAFCMYFYWFGGRTLLELPHRQWLDDPSITLPICLCWANENWTRTWDGRADDVLITQRHSDGDDLAYIAHVAPYLRDPRYLRIDGKPLLLVYRPGKLPDAKATAARWRAWCRGNGIGELCIGYVQAFERPDPRAIGFDLAVEFPPNLSTPTNITERQTLLNPDYRGEVLDWRDVARDYSRRPMPGYRLFPGVNCGWDNEARRPGRGRTFLHASPRRYHDWLRSTLTKRLAAVAPHDRVVFINAWNEWAESAVLEPDARSSHHWLQATRSALWPAPPTPQRRNHQACAVVHAWYPDVLDELLQALQRSGIDFRLVVTTVAERAAEMTRILARHPIKAEVEIHENRGRDILPFLQVANRLLDEGESLVLKLHTKRSRHRDDGDLWRHELVERLASPDNAQQILEALTRDPALGLVAPEGHVQPLHYFWGANAGNTLALYAQVGIAPPDPAAGCFVSGSMFWARLEALRPLLDASIQPENFEPEAGQVDGTLAHAIERAVLACVEQAGYRVQIGPTSDTDAPSDTSASYRFAKRD